MKTRLWAQLPPACSTDRPDICGDGDDADGPAVLTSWRMCWRSSAFCSGRGEGGGARWRLKYVKSQVDRNGRENEPRDGEESGGGSVWIQTSAGGGLSVSGELPAVWRIKG